MTHTPRLWFGPADITRIQALVKEGQPTAAGIAALAKRIADMPLEEALGETLPDGRRACPPGHKYAEACAICYLLTGDAAYAQKAHAYFLAMTAAWHLSNLGKGHWALTGAIVHEACYAAWSPAQRVALTRLLIKLVGGVQEVTINRGDPHSVTNNHWSVNHASAAVAAMAAHGCPIDEKGTPADLSNEIAWAAGRAKVFIAHHGDQGLYHEGLGYLGYPATFWWPFLTALKNFNGTDLIEVFPNLRNQAAALYASVAARPTMSDETLAPTDAWGSKISWNDDGQGWMSLAANPLMIHHAHPHQKGGLRTLYDRLNGVDVPDAHAAKRFGPEFAGFVFTLFYYPYDVPAEDPDKVLPTHYTDYRQGLTLFRNRYRDGDDAILGAYARVQFPGGHAQDDAGSIRFMALGHDWIMGGGQAKGKAEWQSIVTPANGDRSKNPRGLGAVMFDEATPHGGVFAMDLRPASISYHERYIGVDYSGNAGVPAVLALLDQVDDHKRDRDWLWNMVFAPDLTCTLHDDRAGFTLAAADGATLEARFLGTPPDALSLDRTPDSSRRFQSLEKLHVYPGRPYVSAMFKNRPRLGIYVVMTVGRGVRPTITRDRGVAVRIGAYLWQRPFGAAVPQEYEPGLSGNLCLHPSGRDDFRADDLVKAKIANA